MARGPPKSASLEVIDCRLVRRMRVEWHARCDVPDEAPLNERPRENEEVENLVRMKHAGDDDEPLEVFEHGAERIEDAAPQKRADQCESVTLGNEQRRDAAEPAESQVEREGKPLGEIGVEDRRQGDAGDRRGPDEEELDRALPAAKQQPEQ